MIEKRGVKPLAILLTHAHFDHIGAVDEVREKWGIPVYIHKKEEDWLGDTSKNGSAHFMQRVVAKDADHLITEEGELKIGSFTFKVFETPGHSREVFRIMQKKRRLFSRETRSFPAALEGPTCMAATTSFY